MLKKKIIDQGNGNRLHLWETEYGQHWMCESKNFRQKGKARRISRKEFDELLTYETGGRMMQLSYSEH